MSRLLHLSHTDLDGYGCQYITSKIISCPTQYYNADYHNIDEAIAEILENIKVNETFLITDLNLKIEQSTFLDDISKEKKFNLILVDHHGTGVESANKFDWYNLDVTKSATLLTYEYFEVQNSEVLAIAELIDTYDMWRKEKKFLFQRATYLSNIIFNYKLDSTFDNKFKRDLIHEIGMRISIGEDLNLIESQTPALVTELLLSYSNDISINKIFNNNNICSSYKMSIFPALEIKPFYKRVIEGNYIYFYTDIKSGTFQYCSDYLFENDETFKDIILVRLDSKSGTMSFRSLNEKAVNIAKLFGGGGHKNAAGAAIELNQDIDLKENIEFNLKWSKV